MVDIITVIVELHQLRIEVGLNSDLDFADSQCFFVGGEDRYSHLNRIERTEIRVP